MYITLDIFSKKTNIYNKLYLKNLYSLVLHELIVIQNFSNYYKFVSN